MKKVKLIFGTNNCLAPGSLEESAENAYQMAYKPFLTTLYKFPEISLTLYYSGRLLEWFQEKHPEFLMLINDMVKRDQVELLGGAFYEPILPLIPARDRTGQIELLSTFIRKKFGKRPRGIWIAEKVWEPGLPANLKNCGMNYVFLDEDQFQSAGLRNEDLKIPCLTEDLGKTLLVFPVSSSLAPFPYKVEPEKMLQTIMLHARDDGNCVVSLIDDGERWGVWGNSHSLLYKKDWLAEFLELIKKRNDALETAIPGNYKSKGICLKKRYFTCSAYEQMMSWSLPSELAIELEKVKNGRISKSGKAFLRGGYFRQFLTKYSESNLMYAKLNHVSVLVNQIRGDKYKKKSAQMELWKSECHEGYWHGKKGGIYRRNLRKSIYGSLIEAEKATRERGIFKPNISNEDFDMDGLEEYLFQGNDINMYVHCVGGAVFELDYLPKSWNYLDTFTRGKEMYHEYQNGNFPVDLYPRRSFIDHIFQLKEKRPAFQALTYREAGNYISALYDVSEYKRDHMELGLCAESALDKQNPQRRLALKKSFTMKGKSIHIVYSLINASSEPLSFCFGSEINLSFYSNEEKHLLFKATGDRDFPVPSLKAAESGKVQRFKAIDKHNKVEISLSFSEPCRLWSFPVEASWISNAGFESDYQYSCFVPHWDVALKPEEQWSQSVKLLFKD